MGDVLKERNKRAWDLAAEIAEQTPRTLIDVRVLIDFYTPLTNTHEELKTHVLNHIHSEISLYSVRKVVDDKDIKAMSNLS